MIQNYDHAIIISINSPSNYFNGMHPIRIEYILPCGFELSLCNKTCYRFGGFEAFHPKICKPYGQTYGNKLGNFKGTFPKNCNRVEWIWNYNILKLRHLLDIAMISL